MQRLVGCAAALLPAALAIAAAGDATLAGRIELPGTRGRIDHLAFDAKQGRLFVAALESNAVEVVSLKDLKRIARLEGRREPQGIAYLPSTQRLLVANGEGGDVEAFDSERRAGAATGLPDADNVRFDAKSGSLYVGYGTGLAALDPATLKVLDRIALPGHPEAFELSARGPEIYVNVPTAGAVVVVDRRTGKETSRWAVAPASRNFPMAFDEANQRLFVATRAPSGLQVFDTASGKRVSQSPLCGDADDLFLDSERRVLYALCGDGHFAVINVGDGDRYETIRTMETSPGARTGLWVQEKKTLFVAAPASGGRPAAVLVYQLD